MSNINFSVKKLLVKIAAFSEKFVVLQLTKISQAHFLGASSHGEKRGQNVKTVSTEPSRGDLFYFWQGWMEAADLFHILWDNWDPYNWDSDKWVILNLKCLSPIVQMLFERVSIAQSGWSDPKLSQTQLFLSQFFNLKSANLNFLVLHCLRAFFNLTMATFTN